jgi:glycosyltransferase involved in cell wall biosynthesis
MTHIEQFSLPIKRPEKWNATFARLRELVGMIQPDVIHSHFVGTTLTMRLALGKKHPIPRIFQVPGPLHLEHMLFREAEIRLAGPNDAWIGSCLWTCRQYLASGISSDRVFLAYYGSDPVAMAPRVPGSLRHLFQIPQGRAIVGMVAYMYAPKRYLLQRRGLKGHEDLIDALALCRDGGIDVAGVFVGGAWGNATEYERSVRTYAKKRLGDGGIFLGTRNDVIDLYPDFTIAVHPSHSENLGGAAESLLLQVPTIATDVGGFPDIVQDGETGWLVPPGSPEALASAIADVIANPLEARRRAIRGQELAHNMLNIQQNAKDVITAYEQVVARSTALRGAIA